MSKKIISFTSIITFAIALIFLPNTSATSGSGITRKVTKDKTITAEIPLKNEYTNTIKGITKRVSVSTNGEEGNEESRWPAISETGQYITFSSVADNLVSNDSNEIPDVFLHNRLTGETALVSLANDGSQQTGIGYHLNSSVSSDGRFVALEAISENIVPGDTDNRMHIFLRDIQMETTTRISVASDGTIANQSSYEPVISANGRFVAFLSYATNLVADDTNFCGDVSTKNCRDVFVRDLQTEETIRVSVSSAGIEANQHSWSPSISADGRFIVFQTHADNLVPNDTNLVNDVFVHDRITGETTRVSVSSDGEEGNDMSSLPSISGDGRYVAFSSGSDNLLGDGEDTNGKSDVFVHDRITKETERVSIASDGTQGNGSSGGDLSISHDGRYIAFQSRATNFHPGDNFIDDIFVHDRLANRTTLISLDIHGNTINVGALEPAISFDGRYIAFTAYDDDLVENDNNSASDIFLRDMWGGAPTLDLPFHYPSRGSDSGFAGVFFRSAFLSRTTSVFDHDLPNYITNTLMLPYLGYTAVTYPSSPFPCGPPNYECYDGHPGYDFSATINTPVLPAISDTGTITVTWGYDAWVQCNLNGRTFQTRACKAIVDHDNEFQTQYLHLQQLSGSNDNPSCRIGTASINIGDSIGTVGMTGCTSGPHIHFEVLYNDIVLDPSGWLGTADDPWASEDDGSESYRFWRHLVPWRELWSINGENGGSFSSSSGATTIDIPAGAFSGLGDFTLTDVPVSEPSATLKPTGHSFILDAIQSQTFDRAGNNKNGLETDLGSTTVITLTQPLTITIHYTDTEIIDLDENTLMLNHWDEQDQTWKPVTTTLDTGDNTAIASTDMFGLFALLIDDNDIEGPDIGQPIFLSTVPSNQWLNISVPISDTLTGDHGVSDATLFYSFTYPYTQTAVAGIWPGSTGDGNWVFNLPPQGSTKVGEILKFSIEAFDGDLSPTSSVNNNNGHYFEVIITEPEYIDLFLPSVVRNR